MRTRTSTGLNAFLIFVTYIHFYFISNICHSKQNELHRTCLMGENGASYNPRHIKTSTYKIIHRLSKTQTYKNDYI